MSWYFAYGSNLWIDQMATRIGTSFDFATAPRIVRLPDRRLAFNMRGQDGQVYANLHSPGDHVLGVIYSCAVDVLEKLDSFEEGYRRERISVLDGGGTTVEAYAYISQPENVVDAGIPRAEYVQRILRGGRQHGLPESYLREIAELAQTGLEAGQRDGEGLGPTIKTSPRHSPASPSRMDKTGSPRRGENPGLLHGDSPCCHRSLPRT